MLDHNNYLNSKGGSRKWNYIVRFFIICKVLHYYLKVCFSRVQHSVTLWTMACQVPLSMGFSRQEYWSGLPFPFPNLT